MKNKNNIIKTFLVLIVLLPLLLYLYYSKNNNIEVSLIDNLNIEINKEIKIKDLIKDTNKVEINNIDEIIDTKELGEKEIILKLKDNKEFIFKINIIDNTKPIINGDKEIVIKINNDFDINKYLRVEDNSNEKIELVIESEYDTKKVGTYKLKVSATDSSKNREETEITLKVVDDNNYTFTTQKGFIGKVINGVTYIDNILIANKTYSLPSTYGNGITKEVNEKFNILKNAAKSEGIDIFIKSGFRSYNTQKTIYNNYVKSDGQKEADTYSARPGNSEHQSGLAMDVNQISSNFINTKEGKWINDNCYKYGFIIRYPKGKEGITGYIYEPWHIRYVGIDIATILYNNGTWLSLEEYFGITSKY